MIKEISKETYFGTLMSVLTDDVRRLMRTMDKEYTLEKEAYKINAEMTKAGCWMSEIPGGMKNIIHTVPQDFVQDAMEKVLPQYRKRAWDLIEHFKQSSIKQGADAKVINEDFDKKYKW